MLERGQQSRSPGGDECAETEGSQERAGQLSGVSPPQRNHSQDAHLFRMSCFEVVFCFCNVDQGLQDQHRNTEGKQLLFFSLGFFQNSPRVIKKKKICKCYLDLEQYLGPHLNTNVNSLPKKTPLELVLTQNNHHPLRNGHHLFNQQTLCFRPLAQQCRPGSEHQEPQFLLSVDFTFFVVGRDGQ